LAGIIVTKLLNIKKRACNVPRHVVYCIQKQGTLITIRRPRPAKGGEKEKQMTKHEYAKRHGLTLRRVTLEDKFYAHTDYQCGARYIIQGGDGEEWFSARGSLSDMIDYVNAHLTAER
jgi:hypothetical protein